MSTGVQKYGPVKEEKGTCILCGRTFQVGEYQALMPVRLDQDKFKDLNAKKPVNAECEILHYDCAVGLLNFFDSANCILRPLSVAIEDYYRRYLEARDGV